MDKQASAVDRRAYAVVTGAGSGIGQAVAWALSAVGVPLVLVGRRAEALAATQAGCVSTAHSVACDVADSSCAAQIVDQLSGAPVAYLAQLAGVMEFGPLASISRATWERAFATNTHSRLFLLQSLLPHLSPTARVLFVGSRSGTRPRRGAAAYSCSYAATMMLSECLRAEWAGTPLRLTTFLPGSVDTPLLQRSMDVSRELFPDGAVYEAERARGELLAPAVVAQFVRWLFLSAPADVYDAPLVQIDDPRLRAAWLASSG